MIRHITSIYCTSNFTLSDWQMRLNVFDRELLYASAFTKPNRKLMALNGCIINSVPKFESVWCLQLQAATCNRCLLRNRTPRSKLMRLLYIVFNLCNLHNVQQTFRPNLKRCEFGCGQCLLLGALFLHSPIAFLPTSN